MVVNVKNAVVACDTSMQGQEIYQIIAADLNDGCNVVLDFSGIPGMTSSFANCAFIPLLNSLSFEDIKRNLSVVHANRQIMNMLRDRMMVHAERLKNAA